MIGEGALVNASLCHKNLKLYTDWYFIVEVFRFLSILNPLNFLYSIFFQKLIRLTEMSASKKPTACGKW